jgi:hypothetical protein
MAVFDGRLFVYGGLTERGRAEHNLNDLWSLDLKKLDSWKCHAMLADECLEWYGTDSDADDDDDDVHDDDGVDFDGLLKDGGTPLPGDDASGEGSSRRAARGGSGRGGRAEAANAAAASTPQLGESLREFFARTADYWATAAHRQREERFMRSAEVSPARPCNRIHTSVFG